MLSYNIYRLVSDNYSSIACFINQIQVFGSEYSSTCVLSCGYEYLWTVFHQCEGSTDLCNQSCLSGWGAVVCLSILHGESFNTAQ